LLKNVHDPGAAVPVPLACTVVVGAEFLAGDSEERMPHDVRALRLGRPQG
jgi:hypothetical protein